MLTDAFKDVFNAPREGSTEYDFASYAEWWDTVAAIETSNVHIVEQSGTRAVVYADLVYNLYDGRRIADSAPYSELTYTPGAGGWRFEDKRSAP